MSTPLQRIVIVGGGTAGWLTASILAARKLQRGQKGLSITLLEAPGIPTIGVGEGSWPTLRETLRDIGLSEFDFLKTCGASFKQGSLFQGWLRGGEESYLHPFTPPAGFEHWDLIDAWRPQVGSGDFANDLAAQTQACAASLAPRLLAAREYTAPLNYGYHFDAGKLGSLLSSHAVKELGVRHVEGEVDQVISSANGDIETLVLASGKRIQAELFIDCTGLASRLLGDVFAPRWRSIRPFLFNDRALATQVAYGRADAEVASVTRSTAWEKGWIWDIGLAHRRGVGCVYSSDHASEEEARAALDAYIARTAPGCEQTAPRLLAFEPGYREEAFVGNCVGIGLACGFVEPLEASAIVMIERAASDLADLLPPGVEGLKRAARTFNLAYQARWEAVTEFLKLHYALTRRSDSAYWREHADQQSWPSDFADRLETFQERAPHRLDIPRQDALFSPSSYHYVLNGMSAKRKDASVPVDSDRLFRLRQKMDETRTMAERLKAALPGHRAYLDNVDAIDGI